MKKQAIFVLGLMFMFSGFTFSQTKTVTNADLEKFRQKRLLAERDLRENYAEMGFDSPEEIARQNEESRRDLSEFADKLRQDRIAREDQKRDHRYYQDQYDQNQYSPNYSYPNSGFIDYGRFYRAGYYNRYRTRRYNNRGNRKSKRNLDFRQRFINGMPEYVLRNHRFNQLNIRPSQQTVRRRPAQRNRNRN